MAVTYIPLKEWVLEHASRKITSAGLEVYRTELVQTRTGQTCRRPSLDAPLFVLQVLSRLDLVV